MQALQGHFATTSKGSTPKALLAEQGGKAAGFRAYLGVLIPLLPAYFAGAKN